MIQRETERCELDAVETRLRRETRNEWIRAMREQHGWTWARIASIAGVSGPGAAYTMACNAGYVPPAWPWTEEPRPAFWWTTVIPVHRRGR